eukprot:Awhi_evm1s3165
MSLTTVRQLPEGFTEEYIKGESRISLNLRDQQLFTITFPCNFYNSLTVVDLSKNKLTELPASIGELANLQQLNCSQNELSSLPSSLNKCQSLQYLNLSGNNFFRFPQEILSLSNLQHLFFGVNNLVEIPSNVYSLKKLLTLFLAGNQLTSVPTSLCRLSQLSVLNLSNNQLSALPHTMTYLRNLKTLLLHSNRLTSLPASLITLDKLERLSLRENPLINAFVRKTYDPLSLKELAARVLYQTWKVEDLKEGIDNNSPGNPACSRSGFTTSQMQILPQELRNFIKSARPCLNPHCSGVYFDNYVDGLTFVDFCGAYRVPLLSYICKPHDIEDNTEAPLTEEEQVKLRKVILSSFPSS